MKQIDVSVVVCTYNRAELLRGALASLAAQRTDDCFCYEIVVVDNASNDGTPEVIVQAERQWPERVRGVREPKGGVSAARNRGIAEARGEWIAFFDDDQIAGPGWLLALVKRAKELGARCLGGSVCLLLPPEMLDRFPPECRGLLGETRGMDRLRRYSRKTAACTCNLLLHRSVLEEVGTFDESLTEAGEDTDLYRRIRAAGIEAWHVPEAEVQHVTPAYRLSDTYLRWRFLRFGAQLARRDRRRWGLAGFTLVLAARLGQLVFDYLPRWLLAQVMRSFQRRLAARCRLWRAEGYFRFAAGRLAPRLLARPEFLAELDFRSERERFGCQQNQNIEAAITPGS